MPLLPVRLLGHRRAPVGAVECLRFASAMMGRCYSAQLLPEPWLHHTTDTWVATAGARLHSGRVARVTLPDGENPTLGFGQRCHNALGVAVPPNL